MTIPYVVTLGFGDYGGGGGSPPLTPTLAIADNTNGTGATATITGGSAGATHKVYTSPFNPLNIGAINFTLNGPPTGNGTEALPLAVGYYIGIVQAEQNGSVVAGNAVYFLVSNVALVLTVTATVARRHKLGDDEYADFIVAATQLGIASETFTSGLPKTGASWLSTK